VSGANPGTQRDASAVYEAVVIEHAALSPALRTSPCSAERIDECVKFLDWQDELSSAERWAALDHRCPFGTGECWSLSTVRRLLADH
jgi:hypothetical protein